ncbi:MAG: hypothetical protein EA394_01615 [Bacteroidia bacterium]|nr:MAG: hypothetical protein EA394_01615 [Bacteroidia bacterium]
MAKRRNLNVKKMMVRKKIYFLLLIILPGLIMLSCRTWFFPRPDTGLASMVRAADPGLSHNEYVFRLLADGWPVDTLNTAANADYLADQEKSLILAHNMVRYNPRKFARLYVNEYISYFIDREFHYPGLEAILITEEGAYAARELYVELMQTRPMGLLYPAEGLSGAADSHLQYLIERRARGHAGQGGLRARIERFGTWQNRLAENIAYGSFSPHDALLYLLINDQVSARSHRRIILDPDFHYVGVARGTHPAFPTGDTYVLNYAYFFQDM